jgi:hypothetical protein
MLHNCRMEGLGTWFTGGILLILKRGHAHVGTDKLLFCHVHTPFVLSPHFEVVI